MDADNFANIPPRYTQKNGTPGPDQETMATGDAGKRVACGVIGSATASTAVSTTAIPPTTGDAVTTDRAGTIVPSPPARWPADSGAGEHRVGGSVDRVAGARHIALSGAHP